MNEDQGRKSQIENQVHEIPASPRELHLEIPLYKGIAVTEINLEQIFELLCFSGTIDAYCIYCQKESVFQNSIGPSWDFSRFKYHLETESESYVETSYVCTRNSAHEYLIYFRLCGSIIQKVGQFPSVADLQIPQIQKYRKLLGNGKYREFTRAIGLAAHGIGIGSFVYLRRVFEGLIEQAHSAASQLQGFDEKKYGLSRIEDKILLLKDFLPKFLVKHRSIYSILSKGIHELGEEECLECFNPVKVGIELILDQKIKEIERKKKERKASQTINKIVGKLKTKNAD